MNPQRKNFMIRLFIQCLLFFIAHVKHYVLLFMIWDFDLEFSMFEKFSLFMNFQTRFH